MNRNEAWRLRHQLERSATLQTDEDALNSKWMYPEWASGTAYEVGFRVRDGEDLYKCVQAHTSQDDWRPSVTPALWTRVFIEEWPEWIQPTGAQDAYKTGDKVSHNDKHWISNVDANTWEPGVYGWDEVTE